MAGYIKLHRKIAEHRFWHNDPFSRPQAWIDLILLANWDDGFVRIRGNRIDLKRGQLAGSLRFLAPRWKWSPGKVKRFLKELENDSRIEQQKNAVTNVITITNYDLYQGNGTENGAQTERRRSADARADGTTKEETKNKKEENKNLFSRFWESYPSRNGKRVGKVATEKLFSKLDETDAPLVVSAAKNYAASKTAMDGFAKDPERFLKNEFWRDWVDEAKKTSRVATDADAANWSYFDA